MIYFLSKQFLNEFIDSIAWINASSIQHDAHFVNQGPVYSKVDDKVGFALGRGYFVTVVTKLYMWLGLHSSLSLHWTLLISFIFVSRTQSAPTSWVYKTPKVQL